MKKQTSLIGIIVTAGLGLAFVVGCCTCKHHMRSSGSSPIVVYGAPIQKSGTEGTCPGSFSGFITYTQVPPAWGWAPDTNTTTFTAANGGLCNNTKIEFVGEYGDQGCSLTNVVIPNPPFSPSYIFFIYFSSNTPTTNYPIILTGFNTNN
jgi:hypothetical protein